MSVRRLQAKCCSIQKALIAIAIYAAAAEYEGFSLF